MGDTPLDLQSYFLQQGILGVIILALGLFIFWLFRRLDAKDKVIENRDQIIQGLQDKRVADYKENGERLITASNNLLTGMQSLRDAAGAQTTAITKVLDNLAGRSQ